MKYPVHNQSGEKIKEVELNPSVFEVPVKEELVHQVVVAQMANSRQVLAHTKQRAEVRGGGRKPWRQKGTGRARHGSIRSPLWKGGGVTFGPTKERNFTKSINKKMKRKALFMTLSDKVIDKHLILLDELKVDGIKTKKFNEMINKLFSKVVKDETTQKTLIVVPETDKNLIMSSKNLSKIKVIRADSLNVIDVIEYDYLLVPEKSLEIIKKIYVDSI